jgi:predicted lipid-binding transport protein (Tim44 family)
MPADLLLYIVIAAVLIVWLRNTLGTRHGDERQRPNPLSEVDVSNSSEQRGRLVDMTDTSGTPDPGISPFEGIDMADKSVEEGLKQVMRADRSFDPHRFIAGAREAFPLIVESFSEGDTDTLQDLLAPNVYKAFADVIDTRRLAGETVKTEIHSVRRVEIADARVVDRLVLIKVRFTAQETCVIRNREGVITSGNPDRITEMTDVWTFGRDVRSKDPTWLLYETSDDVPEDHKTPIPNAG